jgi:hypothetical protein
MREKDLVNQIMAFLRRTPGCTAEKRHGTPYGKVGQPDITGCLMGHRFEIEVKVGRNKPTEMQSMRLNEWREAGASVCVVWSLDEAKEFIRKVERRAAG